MAVYTNRNKDSALAAVEFTPVAQGNFAFVYLRDPAQSDEVKQRLSKDIGQQIVAETQVKGQTVLVTQGDKSQDQLKEIFAGQGEALKLTHRDKKFNPWFWRGAMSMIGQPMQLASSILQKGGLDVPTAVFASSNITANLINMFFGAEKSTDEHRLRFIKSKINTDLGEHVSPSETLPLNDKRADTRKDPERPKTTGEKISGFIRANSVRGGEIGLRYFGSVALVLPPAKWKEMGQHLKTGSVVKAFKASKNTDKWNFWVGVSYLAGKSIGFLSKVPDPYNPKPHTWVDEIREKYLFRLSTAIETVAASVIVWDRFSNRQITMPNKKLVPPGMRGKSYRDFLGGIGGALFVAGFAIRFFAPFGEKAVSTDEVYAHITDTLAKTPPEKIPQLLAESAATVKEHLKDKPIEYGEIYTQMMTDLYRYHHVAIKKPEEKSVAENIVAVAKEPQAAANFVQKNPQRQPLSRIDTPATSHAESAARSGVAAQPTVG